MQARQSPLSARAAVGGCFVTVTAVEPATIDRTVTVRVNTGFDSLTLNLRAGEKTATLPLGGPLTDVDVVSVKHGGADVPFVLNPHVSPSDPKCPKASSAFADDRDGFVASAYVGRAVDNFAPSSVGRYVEDPTVTNKSRFIGGVDFEFRVFGQGRDVQLWLVGETLHGVRTADVNCTDVDPAPPICNTRSNGESLRYLIENASSLEAFITPRLELLTLNRNSAFAAKFYLAPRFGLIGLSDAPRSFRAHHFGAGLISIAGVFEGSTLEVGWGRTDLFPVDDGRSPWHRFKLDALLSFDILPDLKDSANPLKRAAGSMRPFLQFYLDNDLQGPGADSIQSFFGIDFDVRVFGR